MDDQNQTRLEGIDTTEATNANAGYFDFGSFEEFQVGGAGADASAFAGGAVLSISVKSGSDRFSGSWYSDYQNEDMIANNVPDYLQVANEKNEDGYFTRTPLERGNQIQKQYDLNGNVGGPIWRGKIWGFYSYRLNDQYKYTTGLPSNIEQLEADQPLHVQGHLPGDAEQPADRLHQQAPEAAGQARHQRDHAALGRLLPVVGEHADEGRVDQRARQPRVPRRDGRQLVELLPAAPGQRLRPLRRPVGPGPRQPGQQPDLRRRRQQRLPGPEALEAAGLRQPVVLQGRLGRQPRLQGRLRHRSATAAACSATSRSTSSTATTAPRCRRSTSTTPTSPASTTSSTRRSGSTTPGSSPTASR